MDGSRSAEPHLKKKIKKLIAETEHLIEEGHRLVREVQITRQTVARLAAARRLPKPSQRGSVAETDRATKKIG
jgi:hypothetical protein